MFNPWFALLVLIAIVAQGALWALKPAVLGKSGFGALTLALFPLSILTVQTLLVRRAIKTIASQRGAAHA